MAHQTGITASKELLKLMADALHDKLRMLQVTIDQDKEQLIPGIRHPPNSTWEDDFDDFILPSLEDKHPCYIFYRLDERNAHEKFLWIFLTYTPDEAPIREKMLYSATKATLKKSFNSAVMIDDINATTKDEMSLAGYKKHVESANAAPPLTREEQELKLLHEAEDHIDIGTTTRQSHLHGVAFPIESDVIDALREMKAKRADYIQLSIDLSKEIIVLEDLVESLEPDNIASCVPDSSPRYHLFLFKHTHEGDYQESFVFIYSCPGYKCSIKERTVYSSCKNTLSSAIENDIGIEIAKKIEVDGPGDLNEKYLMDELHPMKQAYRPQFDKPKPPVRRAAKKK